MNRLISFALVAIFSVFLGSQITEGVLLVPFWQSLPSAEFYENHAAFGPLISQYYTILTVVAVLIPLGLSIYCLWKKSPAYKYSLVSTIFASLIIVLFYGYFKGANQEFHDATLDAIQLKTELIVWGKWHWLRVVLEFVCLVFLMLTLKGMVTKPQLTD